MRNRKKLLLKSDFIAVEKSVGAIVVNQAGLYLLLNRADKNSDFWEFPKGHQSEGENDIQTLKRELKEETGIEKFELIKSFAGKNEYVSSSTGNTRIILLYLIKVPNDKVIISQEHKEYVWVTFDDALTKLNHNKWKEILTSTKRRLAELNS